MYYKHYKKNKNYKLQAYVISLKSETSRYNKFIQHNLSLTRHFINYNKVDACDTTSVPNKTFSTWIGYFKTPIMTAIAYSHLKCLELVLQSSYEYVLIMEDDAYFFQDWYCDFVFLLQQYLLTNLYDVIDLEDKFVFPQTFPKTFLTTKQSKKYVQKSHLWIGSACYLVTRKGAIILYNTLKSKIETHIDITCSLYLLSPKTGFVNYGKFVPGIAYQRHDMGSHNAKNKSNPPLCIGNWVHRYYPDIGRLLGTTIYKINGLYINGFTLGWGYILILTSRLLHSSYFWMIMTMIHLYFLLIYPSDVWHLLFFIQCLSLWYFPPKTRTTMRKYWTYFYSILLFFWIFQLLYLYVWISINTNTYTLYHSHLDSFNSST